MHLPISNINHFNVAEALKIVFADLIPFEIEICKAKNCTRNIHTLVRRNVTPKKYDNLIVQSNRIDLTPYNRRRLDSIDSLSKKDSSHEI